MVREISQESPQPVIEILGEVAELLQEFQDISPIDLLNGLPLDHGIQHIIDLVPGVAFPNLPHHWLKPTKHAKLKWQLDNLLSKGFTC